MAGWTNCIVSWKKRETKEESSLITHGLFGVIKNLHRKTLRSEPVTVFSGYQTVKMFENSQREFELQKSRTIAQCKLQIRLI